MASGFMSIFQKLEKYDGKEDLTMWFQKFERCCTLANKVEDNVKGQLVMLCLSGQALAVAEQLAGEIENLTLTLVRQRLDSVFNTPAIREQKMVLFEQRTQKLDESEDEFMLSLTTLYRAANPDANAPEINKSVKRKFMQGISPHLRRAIYVFTSDPFAVTVTHQRLLESARNAKLSLIGEENPLPGAVPAVNTVASAPPTVPASTDTSGPSNADVMGAITALAQTLTDVVHVVNTIGGGRGRGNFHNRGRGRGRGRARNNNNRNNNFDNNNNNNNRSNNFNNNQAITCYRCGGPNHRARDCTSLNC